MVSREVIPSIRVEHISIITPERRQTMYSVSMNIDGSFCRDVVPAEAVVGNGLANGHGDGGNVAEGFAADVVQVVKVVGVEFGEAVDVVAGHGVEEEGEVLFNLCSDAFLDFGVRGE